MIVNQRPPLVLTRPSRMRLTPGKTIRLEAFLVQCNVTYKNLIYYYQFCEVFQAVINALLMRILTGLGPFFWRILPAEGPQNNSQKAGSLGCCKYVLLCKKFVSPSLLSTLKLTRTKETNSWLLRGFNFRSSLCLLGCQKDNRHGCREEVVYNSLNPKISPNVV